jgi:hypothetical protein
MGKGHTPYCGPFRQTRRQLAVSDTPNSVNYCVMYVH